MFPVLANTEDDISCVCGLNKEVLDKLESIVSLSTKSECSANNQSNVENNVSEPDQSSQSSSTPEKKDDFQGDLKDPEKPAASSQSGLFGQPSQPTEGSADMTSGNVTNDQNIVAIIARLTSEIQRLEAQLHMSTTNIKPVNEASSQTQVSATSLPAISWPSTSFQLPTFQNLTSNFNSANTLSGATNSIHTFAFLQGLSKTPIELNNEALMKLNQSSTVKPETMASALQSTVPNVVSSIFLNIKNLTTQAEQNLNTGKGEASSDQLTSIDGSSVNIKGNSSVQITAEGEKLFQSWIDHQLNSLHLTASAANYIRKNALNLFRRIVNQYVDRMARIGGGVEQNVLKATQMALNNTQTIVSFILRNYINFAGGLMQIIGEQVSRFGRRLDSTGETIAHISLNPFDIVSNVMESLPNPSQYAQYFRAFGKQLIGEISSFGQNEPEAGSSQATSASPTTSNPTINESQTNNNIGTRRPQGLINTLGKTITSWIG